MRVLVVEDEIRLARHIASALTEAGDNPVVIHDGEEALREAVDAPFDLIVLDIGLPRMDGFEVLRQMREQHVTSRVLILTARGQVNDRVTGLQLGADDYLAKPFAMQELLARVRAMGRRYAEETALNLRVDDLALDLVNHVVHRGTQRIELSARVWEHPHEYDTKLVEVFIGRLRKKIGEPSLIQTVRHVGYTISNVIAG